MLFAQKLFPIFKQHLQIYEWLTTILIKTDTAQKRFKVTAKSNTRKFLVKLFLSVTLTILSYYSLFYSYNNLPFISVIQTVFYQVAFTFHIPILLKLYENNKEVVNLLNCLLDFENKHNG